MHDFDHKLVTVSQTVYICCRTIIPKQIKCIAMKPRSKTTTIVEFSRGWKFSFQIHSAKTAIESSLKFDIEFFDNNSPEGVESQVILLN